MLGFGRYLGAETWLFFSMMGSLRDKLHCRRPPPVRPNLFLKHLHISLSRTPRFAYGPSQNFLICSGKSFFSGRKKISMVYVDHELTSLTIAPSPLTLLIKGHCLPESPTISRQGNIIFLSFWIFSPRLPLLRIVRAQLVVSPPSLSFPALLGSAF